MIARQPTGSPHKYARRKKRRNLFYNVHISIYLRNEKCCIFHINNIVSFVSQTVLGTYGLVHKLKEVCIPLYINELLLYDSSGNVLY